MQSWPPFYGEAGRDRGPGTVTAAPRI